PRCDQAGRPAPVRPEALRRGRQAPPQAPGTGPGAGRHAAARRRRLLRHQQRGAGPGPDAAGRQRRPEGVPRPHLAPPGPGGGGRVREAAAAGDKAQGAARLTEAEASFRKAVALAEAEPDAWVALVFFLAGTKQTEKADAALAEAKAKLPPDQVTLTLALCYE